MSNAITIVDCSHQGLTKIPKLPLSVREIRLQNNKIHAVPCTALQNLVSLRILDLSMNIIEKLYNCSFSGLVSLEHLWLSHNQNITSLPALVFESLNNLQELDLSHNMINNIDPGLFKNLTTLVSLNLCNNWLTKLKNGTFKGLSSVVFLSLKANRLRYLPETFDTESFQGLTSLNELRLHGNQPNFQDITYPDQALALVPTLRSLRLDGYPRLLGPGFSSLVHLSHLSFAGSDGGSCSMLAQIPPQFFKHLETKEPLHLNMSSCSFHFIPPELFQVLPKIYSLDLSLNDYLLIEGFEKASTGLENSTLAVLNITDIVNQWVVHTEIKNTTFRYLRHTQLKVLVVEDCSLINVAPKAIQDLPQTMEYISFHGNSIINANALLTFSRLRNLKVVKISKQVHYKSSKELAFHQTIRSREYGHKTSNMQKESSHRNKIFEHQKHVPKVWSTKNDSHELFNIADIFIARTVVGSDFCGDSEKNIFRVSKIFLNDFLPLPLPQKLEILYASDIRLTYNIPQVQFFNNHVLRYLDLSANGINCFGGPIFGLPSLQHLDLSRNWCFKLNPLFFTHLESIKNLLLYKNMLGTSLAKDVRGITFSVLASLENLDLSHNIIQNLQERVFTDNVNLRILNLSNNELTQFSASLVNNTRLEVLDLSFNLLTGLSKSTCKQMQTIKEVSPNFTVRIEGNQRFFCDCDNLYFLNFLLDNPGIFEDVETFHCRLTNGSRTSYAYLARVLPQLGVQCVSQTIFTGVLVAFFLVMGGVSVCALYHFKRWQWKYLYYIGRSRLHIGSMYLTYKPVAHAFVTYDQVRR
ncbi:Toll-like receptor 4 [Elysia marginata]|uniref:Toll-like receptor 4 n=1 Tax=Elysia marginata TaxID=1093978 RepID=A0AAV4G372_9GAST|nr:Toll-like receptor 4 [Elysia marginata]